MNQVTFLGSFPRADFAVTPALPEVAFVGRSNVGKSTLVNRILRRKAIARTSKTPGKTRECNVYQVDTRYHLVDLPGYGFARVSKDERRRLGGLIRQYLAVREPLAGVVWLLDIRRDPTDDDMAIAGQLEDRGVPVLIAVTKGDKYPPVRRAARADDIARAVGLPPDQLIVTSAVSRDGIDDLRDSIDALLDDPDL